MLRNKKSNAQNLSQQLETSDSEASHAIFRKNDFPNFKTRGRVTENRMDLELEKQG